MSNPSLKIALSGYGKMGQLVESEAIRRSHTVVARIDPLHPGSENHLSHADVIIDFTKPDVVLENMRKYAPLKKNIIMGTTGWYDKLPQIKQIVKEEEIGFFYAPNFSLGVALFLKVIEHAAKLIDHYPEYDVAGIEYHHSHKKDAPSGTAKALSDALIKNIKRKKRACFETVDREIKPDELHFPSVRVGHIPGTHSIVFDSPIDSLTFTHQAKTREGFAHGAILAAEWLHGKKGIFTMEDYFT